MFFLLLILAIIFFLISYYTLAETNHKSTGFVLIAAGALVLAVAFQTPQGKMALKKLTASSQVGYWLVVDNSVGETMRHWVLNGYVESHKNSDGWQFTDTAGNLNYVGGDTFVLLIKQDIDKFQENYREKYNIPKDQIALE